MKKYKMIFAGCAALVAVYLGLMLAFKCGLIGSPARKLDGIEEKGISFEELTIPEDIKVVGIGEATHGNCEFQTAKLEMLKKQVETGKCHSIAFEMSTGEAAEINDAIHNDDSDLREIMSRTNYPIYDTEQLVELLTWMRDYNRDKTYEESLMFYGVDMQGPYREIEYLAGFAEKHTDLIDKSELELISRMNTELESDKLDTVESNKEFFEKLRDRLSSEDSFECKNASIIAGSIVQWLDAPGFNEDPVAYGEHRDSSMAKNLKSEYELEVERGYSQIIITAHNGHVMKGDNEGYGEVAMGGHILDEFGGSYFCVGTEFYNATVNIHTAGTFDEEYERADHDFCSDDRLAFQAKFFDGGRYVLDFTKLTKEDGKVYDLVHSPGMMGMVGEGHTDQVYIYKTYRQNLIQADRFDAVMYYYDVTPIRCLDY